MIARLASPFATSAIALLLSVSVGVSVCWKSLNLAIDQARILRAQKKPNEMKKKGWDFWTIEIENLSSELKEDREKLKLRADEIAQREARVQAAEKELTKARADIEGLRKEISEKVIEMQADEAGNLRKLAQTYANLTPRAVVAIVREMDDATAVKILALMKPDVVGPIFEEMTKTAGTDGPLARRAAILSEKLRLMKAFKSAASQ
jgi:flagellar motility protein MotE (MotC chaperone)